MGKSSEVRCGRGGEGRTDEQIGTSAVASHGSAKQTTKDSCHEPRPSGLLPGALRLPAGERPERALVSQRCRPRRDKRTRSDEEDGPGCDCLPNPVSPTSKGTADPKNRQRVSTTWDHRSLKLRLMIDSRCSSPSVPVWKADAPSASISVAGPPPVKNSERENGAVVRTGEMSGVRGPGPEDDQIDVFQPAEG